MIKELKRELDRIEKHLVSLDKNRVLSKDFSVDAGGRLRVSQVTTLIDVKQDNDNAPKFYDRVNVGGATQIYDVTRGGSIMSVSSNGDIAVCQTKMWAPYYSGKSQVGEITFDDFVLQTDVIKTAAYANVDTSAPHEVMDGFGFESNGVDGKYYFKIWKLDGTVKFQRELHDYEIEMLKLQGFTVFWFQFLYLGGTAVKFGFIQEGAPIEYTKYNHAGTGVKGTFIKSPQQPVLYRIESKGGAGSLCQICAAVGSEGSLAETGANSEVGLEDAQFSVAATLYFAAAIRLKSAYRNKRVEPTSLDFLAETNDEYKWYLRMNPTISGDALVWNDYNEGDAFEYAISTNVNQVAANNAAMGTHVSAGHCAGNATAVNPVKNAIRPGSKIDGTPDVLALFIQPINTGLDAWAVMNLNEHL